MSTTIPDHVLSLIEEAELKGFELGLMFASYPAPDRADELKQLLRQAKLKRYERIMKILQKNSEEK